MHIVESKGETEVNGITRSHRCYPSLDTHSGKGKAVEVIDTGSPEKKVSGEEATTFMKVLKLMSIRYWNTSLSFLSW